MKIGFAQFDVAMLDRSANLLAIDRLAATASEADLLVFPELATSGYDFIDAAEVDAIAETFGAGPTSEAAARLADRHGMSLVVGYPERAPDGFYNSCLLAVPGGRLFNYRKIHLFSREKLFFRPGDSPPSVVDTPAGRVGMMICFDWIFPETARCLALEGAQIIAHPSNLVLEWCQRAMFARSAENRVFTVTANRIGAEDRAGRKLTFSGASQIVSPSGEYVVRAPETEEHVAVAELDPSKADSKRITEFNDLWDDRRPDLYRRLS
ncbi:MAG: nitrilase-related carbon-nitrogen hydrolase [Candidatus Hydrogenedentota bacterium]